MGWKAMSMSQRFKPLLNIYAYPRWSYCHWQKSTVQSKPKKFLFFHFILTDCLFHQQICEPVKSLKKCKYFRDVTWTYIQYPDNSTQQVMHCRCPKNSVAYLTRRHAYQTVSGPGYQYSFACSPQTVSFIWNFGNIEVLSFLYFITENEVPEKRTLQAIQRPQKSWPTYSWWRQHNWSMSMSA